MPSNSSTDSGGGERSISSKAWNGLKDLAFVAQAVEYGSAGVRKGQEMAAKHPEETQKILDGIREVLDMVPVYAKAIVQKLITNLRSLYAYIRRFR